MDNKPEVTVVMSTFNRLERFTKKAIKSVLDQSFKNFELIVVDDHSNDGTKEYVEGLVKTDKRVRFFQTPQNTGTDARPKNIGLKQAKGDYICFLDDDCEFFPYHIEKLYDKMKANPEIDVVYGDMWLLDADNPKWEGQQGIALNFDAQFLLNRNYIDFSMTIHKKEWAYKVGGIDETLPRFKDWNYFVRMMKAGAAFQRLPMIVTNYYTHKNNTAHKYPVETWQDNQTGMTMFKPTFDPAGCYIYLPYLGYDREDEKNPRVAIFTITYDRLEYTKRMLKSMRGSTKYHFDWFVFDNGSKDGTQNFITKETPFSAGSVSNKGITYASNYLIDKIMELDGKMSADGFQMIIKVDNDCEFMTQGWLESIIDIWKRNHLVYISPYVEGLVDNPGGAQRIGHSFINPYFIEVTQHIGGLFAAIDKHAYKKFRWSDKFLHGNQDREASEAFRKQRYMPCYLPLHRVSHMDTTEGQHQKFPEYFDRRKKEKTTQV